jgi:hypothetical protein
MNCPSCLSSSRLVRLLFIVFASAVLPVLAEAPLQADEAAGTRARFVELDSEIQAIKQEILAINQEILLLEESSLVSQGEQVVVLVSIAAGSTVTPEQITLLIDGETLSRHDYSGGETAALLKGGVHRLFTGRLSKGEHQLEVLLSATSDHDKKFQRQRSINISKLSGRKYIELELGAGDRKSGPDLTIREWQK